MQSTLSKRKQKQTSRQPNSLTASRTTSQLPLAREVSTDGPRTSFLFLSFPLLLFTSILVSSDTSFLPFFLSFVPLSEWVIVALATPSLSLSFCDFFPGIDVTTRGSLREISGCIWSMETVLSDSGSSDFMASKKVIGRKHVVSNGTLQDALPLYCWCNFGASRGLKEALRIYHKIELIPPVPTGPRPRWHPQCAADCGRLETLRKSLKVNVLHFPFMLLKMWTANRFSRNRVVAGYIFVISLGINFFPLLTAFRVANRILQLAHYRNNSVRYHKTVSSSRRSYRTQDNRDMGHFRRACPDENNFSQRGHTALYSACIKWQLLILV